MEPKRLYRSLTDRKVAGVAGGLGEYFEMDPLLFRLIFVVLTLAGGSGMLIYIILWIVTPDNPLHLKPATGQPSGNPGPSTAPPTPHHEDPSGADYNNNSGQPAGPVPQKEKKSGSLTGGLILITIGLIFLAIELIPSLCFGDVWPVLLIVLGCALLINTLTGRKRNVNL